MAEAIKRDDAAELGLTVEVNASNETVVKLGDTTLSAQTSIADVISDPSITRVKLVTPATFSQGGQTYDVSGTVAVDKGECPTAWITENAKLKLEVDVPSIGADNACSFVLSAKSQDPSRPVPKPADPILIVRKRGGP